MDDVRIYDRALSAADVAQLHQITTPQVATNMPISYSGAIIATATTPANGSVSFANVASGRYYIEYSDLPNGHKFATQNIGGVVNMLNSDVNPWSAKTSCFEVYNGLSELNIDAGIKNLPYSSCEATSPADTPILLGQPVVLSV